MTTNDWTAVSAVATSLGVLVATWYVFVTAGLLGHSKKTREADLMLRLMEGYDRLRPEILALRRWAVPDVSSKAQVFRDESDAAATRNEPYNIDDARYSVSRFFVSIRKLVAAGFLSEDVVVAALDGRSIDVVFLKLVDRLDEIAAGDQYRRDDHDYFVDLLRRRYRNR